MREDASMQSQGIRNRGTDGDVPIEFFKLRKCRVRRVPVFGTRVSGSLQFLIVLRKSQLLILARYFLSEKSSRYYRILLISCY
jgi:hypothetical protein